VDVLRCQILMMDGWMDGFKMERAFVVATKNRTTNSDVRSRRRGSTSSIHVGVIVTRFGELFRPNIVGICRSSVVNIPTDKNVLVRILRRSLMRRRTTNRQHKFERHGTTRHVLSFCLLLPSFLFIHSFITGPAITSTSTP
jgi:hypothetical protein